MERYTLRIYKDQGCTLECETEDMSLLEARIEQRLYAPECGFTSEIINELTGKRI